MTKEEQEIERHAFTSAIAGKLLTAIEGNNMITLLTITMSVNNDGYKMLKQMLEFYVPVLKKPNSTQRYIAMDKPTYNGCIMSFHARYCLWYNLEK